LAGLLVCYAGMVILAGVMYTSMRGDNWRRDRDRGSGLQETLGDCTDAHAQAVLNGLKDLTDVESKHFRYAL